MKKLFAVPFFVLAVLLPTVPAAAEEVPVTILYTSDTHGHIAPDTKTVGLDRIAAIKKSLPGSILLDAGDFLHGTPLVNLDQGTGGVEIMCDAGYFAATAGNHEFSHGRAALLQRVREAAEHNPPMRVIAANVLTQDGPPLLEPWARTKAHGLSFCVFGLTTPETQTQASPSAVAGLAFADVRETAARTAGSLRQSGCDIVVALTHIGSDESVPFTSLELAAAVPDLDAVIDGHSHREFASITPGSVPVVSPGAYGNALGKLTLFVDSATRKTVRAENAFIRPADMDGVQPDAAVGVKIAALQKNVDAALNEPITELPFTLPGGREVTRTQETALGNLAADALRAAYGTDTAIINAGNIRESLPKGMVARKHLAATFPFGGTVVSLRVTAAELRDILEHAFSRLPGADGAFPQISGISVALAPALPAGERITEFMVNDAVPEPDAVFTLATNDFLAEGGDGYPHLAVKKRLQSWMSVEAAIIQRLRSQEIIAPLPQGRIMMRSR